MLMLNQDRGISALIQHRESPTTLLQKPMKLIWTDTSTLVSSVKDHTVIKVMGLILLVYADSPSSAL